MKQITILSENKKDPIAKITQILADAGINIESITGEHYGAQAVVTVTTEQQEATIESIEKHEGFQILSEDILLVRVEDELGALAKLSRRFSDAGINIRSIRFVERHDGYALVAISASRTNKALELVKDILVS